MKTHNLFIILCSSLMITSSSIAITQYNPKDIDGILEAFNQTPLNTLFLEEEGLRLIKSSNANDLQYFYTMITGVLQNPRVQQALKDRLNKEPESMLSDTLTQYRAYAKKITIELQEKQDLQLLSPELYNKFLNEIAHYEGLMITAIDNKSSKGLSISYFSPKVLLGIGAATLGVLAYYAYTIHKKEATTKLKNNLA